MGVFDFELEVVMVLYWRVIVLSKEIFIFKFCGCIKEFESGDFVLK